MSTNKSVFPEKVDDATWDKNFKELAHHDENELKAAPSFDIELSSDIVRKIALAQKLKNNK